VWEKLPSFDGAQVTLPFEHVNSRHDHISVMGVSVSNDCLTLPSLTDSETVVRQLRTYTCFVGIQLTLVSQLLCMEWVSCSTCMERGRPNSAYSTRVVETYSLQIFTIGNKCTS
jgi:hypothetical protein